MINPLHSPNALLTDALAAAGLPINGLRSDGSILWTMPPDAVQVATAAQIVAATDVRPRRPKSLANFTQDFSALPKADQVRIDAAVQNFQRWRFFLESPDDAQKAVGAAVLVGDEPDTGV